MMLGDNFDKPDIFLELSMYINSIDGGVRDSRKFSYTFFSKEIFRIRLIMGFFISR